MPDTRRTALISFFKNAGLELLLTDPQKAKSIMMGLSLPEEDAEMIASISASNPGLINKVLSRNHNPSAADSDLPESENHKDGCFTADATESLLKDIRWAYDRRVAVERDSIRHLDFDFDDNDLTATLKRCRDTTSADIPPFVEYKKRVYSVVHIRGLAFRGCASLESVKIPEGITSIGKWTFIDCISLESVTIPASVASIEDGAFGCRALTRIGVKRGNRNYRDIGGVLFSKDLSELIRHPAGKTEQAYVIPDTVTRIGDWAFVACGSLTSVNTPKDVTSIGKELSVTVYPLRQ